MEPGYKSGASNASSRFVMVPVPAERVLDVYTLLASGSGDEPGAPLFTRQWSQDDVSQLVGSVKSALTRRLLAYLAAHPDDWVHIDAITGALNSTPAALRAALSGFTRTIKAHLHRDDWPFDVLTQRRGGGMRTAYRMNTEVAQRLASALSPNPDRPRVAEGLARGTTSQDRRRSAQ